MATKSFVPQLVRRLRWLCIYITKHQSTMAPYLNPQQLAALTSITSACQAFFGVNIAEGP